MATVNGNRVELYITPQTGPESGVPTNPVWQLVPRTNGDFRKQPSFTKSDKVNPGRQGTRNILTELSISGDFTSEIEAANTTLHELMEGAVQGTWSTQVELADVATISFDNAGNVTDTANSFADFVEGQWILFADAVNTENNGLARILTKTDDNNISINKTTVTEAAGAPVNISGRVLRNGNTEKGYSAQKRIPSTAGSGFDFLTFQDIQVSSMNINLTAASILTLDFSFLGREQLDGVLEVSGQTDAPVSTSRILGSINGVEAIYVDNVLQQPCDIKVSDATISIDNGLNGINVIGCKGYGAIASNTITVGGTYNTMVDDSQTQVEMDKMLNETLFSLALVLKDVDGNYLVITRDSTIYTDLEQSDTTNGDKLMNTGTVDSNGEDNTYGTVQFDFLPAVA